MALFCFSVQLKGNFIITHVCRTFQHPHDPSHGVSSVETAWKFTQKMSPRGYVQAMSPGDLHHARNSYSRRHWLTDEAPQSPWYINLSDESGTFYYLCFDFDTKDAAGVITGDLVERAHDDTSRLIELLTEHGISYVCCESSSGLGRHVWVSLAGSDPTTVAALGRAAHLLLPSLDYKLLLNPKTGGVRPPGAPHRNGSVSTVLAGELNDLLAHTTSSEQLVSLTSRLIELAPADRIDRVNAPAGATLNEQYRVTATNPQRARRMPAKAAALFQVAGGGTDPSVNAFNCLLAAATAGWTFEDVLREARMAPGLEHYRSRGVDTATAAGGRARKPRPDHEMLTKLENDWSRAIEIHALHGFVPGAPGNATERPGDHAPDVTELATQVNTIESLRLDFRTRPGRWGGTDGAPMQRAILTALSYLVLHTGRTHVAGSTRLIAGMVGASAAQVWEHLERLRTEGIIRRVEVGVDDEASIWALSERPPFQDFSTPTVIDRSLPSEGSTKATPRLSAKHLYLQRRELLLDIENELLDIRHDVFSYRPGLGQIAARIWILVRELGEATAAQIASLVGLSSSHVENLVAKLHQLKLLARTPDGSWRRYSKDHRTAAARRLKVFGILARRDARHLAERELYYWWLQRERELLKGAPKARREFFDARGRALRSAEVPLRHRLFPPYPTRWDGRGDHSAARLRVATGTVYRPTTFMPVDVELESLESFSPQADRSPNWHYKGRSNPFVPDKLKNARKRVGFQTDEELALEHQRREVDEADLLELLDSLPY